MRKLVVILVCLALMVAVAPPASASFIDDLIAQLFGGTLPEMPSNTSYETSPLVENVQITDTEISLTFNADKTQQAEVFDPDTHQIIGSVFVNESGQDVSVSKEKAVAFAVDDSIIIVRSR